MTAAFDYKAALENGYSEEEVLDFLKSKNPKFETDKALQAGYSPQEVISFLSETGNQKEEQKDRSLGEQALGIGSQYALGAAESALLPYEIAVAPLAQEDAQNQMLRQELYDDIERLAFQKATGVWDEQDQKRFEHLQELVKDPKKTAPFVQTADISTQGLLEKATGADLNPKNFAEKTARITGFIKNPEKLGETFAKGLDAKQIVKSVLPLPNEVLRGVGIEGGLAIAEDGNFGPVGKFAAMVIGDIVGQKVAKAGTAFKEFAKNPKQVLAEAAASFSSSEKQAIQKDIIESFRKDGIQADIGTITDNNLIKMVQARLAQSGLVGQDLEKYKHSLFSDIRKAYQEVADSISKMKFGSEYEAGRVGKDMLENLRAKDLDFSRKMYSYSESLLPEGATLNSKNLSASVKDVIQKLSPGSIKSEGQKKTLTLLTDLQKDLGKNTNVQDLINNKIALNDIINYETQGGAQQLLKKIVSDIDKEIVSYGKKNPAFAQAYKAADKQFAKHAKVFRNKDIARLLREEDPAKLLKRMDTVNGVKSLEKIFSQSKEGQEVFDALKRYKIEEMFANSYISNIEKQMKLGTFSNALEKGKNKQIAREILGTKNFQRLERIQKNAGILQKTGEKFFNASQSGVVAADVAIMAKGINDLFYLLSGNPWPIAKTAGGVGTARGLAKLITNPDFLRRVEDVIIAGKSNNNKKSLDALMKLKPYFLMVKEEQGTESE